MQNYRVGCVIPTYQNWPLLAKHLPAVEKTLRDDDILTIIEDAGSDDTIDMLVARYSLREKTLDGSKESDLERTKWVGAKDGKTVQVLKTRRNVRFAGAVNAAVLETPSEYVLLFNNDVSPHSNTRTELLKTIEMNPDCFAVGCVEYADFDRSAPSGRNQLWFARGLFQHCRHPEQVSGETAWVSGGSGMFSRAKWLELGGFDRNYSPAYWEDIDLCYRAKKLGWVVTFIDDTYVIHQHESTHRDVFGHVAMMDMSWKNGRYFTWKNGNVPQKVLFLLWRPYWWRLEWLERRRIQEEYRK